MADKLDIWLSIIDIIICIIDIILIVYLFFYRLPQEQKKKNQFKKFYRKNHAVRSLARNRKLSSHP